MCEKSCRQFQDFRKIRHKPLFFFNLFSNLKLILEARMLQRTDVQNRPLQRLGYFIG